MPIQFDVSVRYLKEDPWERVRQAHKGAPNTKFRALSRSKNLASFDFLPDDVIRAWVKRLYENGFQGGIEVPSYATSQHELIGLTRVLANEWTPLGIRVNALAPGYFETDLTTAHHSSPQR